MSQTPHDPGPSAVPAPGPGGHVDQGLGEVEEARERPAAAQEQGVGPESADKNPQQGPDSPHGAGQDPSADVLRAGQPTGPVSAAAGNTSTDDVQASSRATAAASGGTLAAPLAPSPLAPQRNAVTAPESPARPGSDMFGAAFGGDTSGFGGLVRPKPSPLSTPRPYGGWFDEAVDALAEAYPGFDEDVLRVVVDRGELTLHVRPARVADVLRVLRDSADLRYELLSSLSGVDYPAQEERLHVVYHLTSMTYRRRLRVETAVTTEDPHVATATGVYPTADFQEREAWDMFGIVFDGHPGLTRILMPDDWAGHPQRKDYPLGGVPVEYKGAQVPPPDERRAYA